MRYILVKSVNVQRLFLLIGMFVICLPLLAGCALTNSIRGGRAIAYDVAVESGFTPVSFKTSHFDLKGFIRNGKSDTLVVYIAGDGKAWINRRTPSSDPTPISPVALQLATKDTAPLVLFLARPCQYVDAAENRNCSKVFWTAGRFAEEVVRSMNEAVDQAMATTGAQKIILTGYSGGGAVAALLASRRSDVEGVVTVAGNLDHALWTRMHNVTPLFLSLNPADYTSKLENIWQVHFVGEDDMVVPPVIAESFVSQFGRSSRRIVVRIAGMKHGGDWPKYWNDTALSFLKMFREKF